LAFAYSATCAFFSFAIYVLVFTVLGFGTDWILTRPSVYRALEAVTDDSVNLDNLLGSVGLLPEIDLLSD